jgi:diaminopimelate epimerase
MTGQTMPLSFHKMHGAGNDFVLIDARNGTFTLDAARAIRLADRHRGIGCDQILVLREADGDCLLRYEIWNADGSPAAQCGNGARCVGLYLALNGEAGAAPFTLQSPSGPVTLARCPDGEFEVVMGIPDFGAANISPALPRQGGLYRLDSPWGPLELGTVSMGNPHALLLIDDIDDPAIPAIGAYISTNQAFPDGCNAGFAERISRGEIRLRVVERGAGETLACGSGACAAVAILRRSGRVGETVDVQLPGGRLTIKWRGKNEPMMMKGPAAHVFRGTMNE